LRGAGIKGLKGIPHTRGNIIRPLLDCTREEIEAYCKENNLSYITDSTNFSTEYTRNKVRLKLLPFLQSDFNQNIVETLAQNALFFSADDILLEELTNEAYNKCVTYQSEDSVKLSIHTFLSQHKALQFRILRKAFYLLTNTYKNLSYTHIISAVKLIENKKAGKKINLAYNIDVIIAYDNVIIEKARDIEQYSYPLEIGAFFYVKEANFYISLNLEEKNFVNGYNNTCTKTFNCDRIPTMFVRNRRDGDKVGSKKLKKLLIDKKIPKHERDNIPLVAIHDNIIWAIDILSAKTNEDHPIKLYIQLWEKV